LPHLVETRFKQNDTVGNLTAVTFDLGFARTTHEAAAAATTLTLKVGPGANKPTLLIIQVRQFDLQHAFACCGALTKNLQDERRAIEHLSASVALKIALLDRGQAGIDQKEVNFFSLDALRQGLDMASADERRRPDFANPDHFGKDDVETNGAGQTLEF